MITDKLTWRLIVVFQKIEIWIETKKNEKEIEIIVENDIIFIII